MNGVSFKGQREVIYGLTQAAAHARSAETCKLASRGPHPSDRSMTEAIHASKVYAYADMAVMDNSFVTAINSMSANDVKKLNLAPQILHNGVSNPLSIFSDAIITALKNHKKNCTKSMEQFFDKITL